MKTRNEVIQEFLAEAIRAARKSKMQLRHEDAYCAAYLAGKVADLSAEKAQLHPRVEDPDRLKQWLLDNPELLYATLGDLDKYEFADMVCQPAALGAYVLMSLQAEMRYQEPDDAEPDHGAEADMRERCRDYKLDEIGVC